MDASTTQCNDVVYRPEHCYYQVLEQYFTKSIDHAERYFFDQELFDPKLRKLEEQYGLPIEVGVVHSCPSLDISRLSVGEKKLLQVLLVLQTLHWFVRNLPHVSFLQAVANEDQEGSAGDCIDICERYQQRRIVYGTIQFHILDLAIEVNYPPA
jgi:hypothetical protein